MSACLWHFAPQVAHAQTLQPQPHPNHYIVLIDASGSTGDNAAKRAIFERALSEQLIPGLYRDGFGAAVPPYDPRQDSLTLHNFGVVTGERATAYTRLKDYDLASDFIHTVLLRQSRIEATTLRELLPPTQTYNYTILAWAKQLALRQSKSTNPEEVSHRTFMIVVHDGLSNEGSPEGEADTVRRYSPDNFQKVKPMITGIDHAYVFTDGRGQQGTAWADEIRATAGSVFVEAYEVISASDVSWAGQGLRLQPFKELRLRWTEESGARPSGILTGKLGDEFTNWMSAAGPAEVSLGAKVNGEATTGSGLELPVVFRGALSCDALPFEGTLRVSLRRADPTLGVRSLEYEHTQGVVAPVPQSCTAAFYARAAAIVLLCLLAAALIAYYFYYRLRVSHLFIEIPGTLRPIRLMRGGLIEGAAPVLPQTGLEALSLKLPGRFWQRLFYRNATLTLGVEGGGESLLGWAATDGPAHVRLPLSGGYIPAHWRRLPTEPVAINISFRQGRQSSNIRLTYPRTLTESVIRSTRMSESNENRVYVALDLGSESMAAYYEDTRGNGGMIKLQSLADKLHGNGDGSSTQLNLLKESQAGAADKTSPRLWNRISFREKKAGEDRAEPDDNHATLHFIRPAVRLPNGKYESVVNHKEYEKSLFQYFHMSGEWPPMGRVLPNPKILFQQQITDLLAPIQVRSKTGDRVRLSPEILIKHLTLQVLVNFVLHSPELSTYNRQNIHLTITVPNVYSLPHAESIKDFIRRHEPNLYDVQVLSESDAVAYYALKGVDQENDPPKLRRFKEALQAELRKSRAASIITLDVGKGTTDLSWVVVQKPKPASASLFGNLLGRKQPEESDEQRRHSVQGKTGKSSGGNYLSYVIACHYEACLKEALDRHPLHKGHTFSFIKEHPNLSYQLPQVRIAGDLDQLIERVKRSMTEDYRIDESILSMDEQRRMLEGIVNRVLEAFDSDWDNKNDEAKLRGYTSFRDEAINLMLLPGTLEVPRRPFILTRLVTLPFRILRWLVGRSAAPASVDAALTDGQDSTPVAPTPRTAALKRELENYVRENVDEMLDSLRSLVDEHQAVKGQRGDVGSSFVVVSGQASQFKPLRKAVRMKCGEMGIGEDQMLMMEGVASKEACCKGVVNFWSAEMQHTNQKELHGTYGCIDANLDTFQPFDMKKLKNNRRDTLNFGEKGRYFVVFTPRSYQEVMERPPRRNDGATALIGVFSGTSSFTIEYIPEALELRVNNKPLTISSFGNVDSSIYKKVWPEILEPHKD